MCQKLKLFPMQETITKRWNLVCGELPGFGRAVQTVFFIGNLIGVFSVGPLSDSYGRKGIFFSKEMFTCFVYQLKQERQACFSTF